MSATAVTDLLKATDIFRDIPVDVLNHLSANILRQTFQPGQAIIRKNEEGSSMYIIASGKVKIHDGEHIVATMEAGNFFGEFSLLDTGPRSMSVTATEQAEVLCIDRETFYKVLEKQTEITKKIISVLTQRLRNQNASIIEQLKSREKELTRLVDERTNDLQKRNIELSETLARLKEAQQQLILSEKMASLGQLTAGIAHEIQNPLNFINNFSEMSSELIEEATGTKSDETRNELLGDIKINILKIFEHGKRADGIVKSMLQHSRSGSTEKQLTNINRLCTDFYNLAYHGTKAKDVTFNCKLEQKLAEDMPKVNLVAQDFGRVFLNLFNNAFYAINEKQKLQSGNNEYQPALTLTTFWENNHVIIKIKDNGTGIPENKIDKIFQPFFTTKPTGYGNTGLGLSISYDIVNAHNGEIKVNSKEGEGTEFTITLPC